MQQKETQENWQNFDGNLGSLRLKVIFAALFSVVFLVVVSFIAYSSFQEMLGSVQKLSSSRPETAMVNSMITDISEIQAFSSRYSLSKNPAYLENYQEKTVHVRQIIDSLQRGEGSKKYEQKLDTLRKVFDEYILALDEYVSLRDSRTDAVEKKIYGIIKSSDSSLKHTSQFLPKAEIKSIVETVERPIEPSEKIDKNTKNTKGKRKRNQEEEEILVDSVSRETTTKIITQVDSSYLYKVDTLLKAVKKSLNTAQKQRSGFLRKITERESELLGQELALMDRIHIILRDIEKEELDLTHASIEFSKNSAQDSYKKLTVLATIAILVMLLLFFTLFSDISKSLFYRKKLTEAKIEAERLALAKEEFLANMSHEIRTPLNSIIGFSEQLENSDIAPGKKAMVHAITRSSNHLLSLVNDILDFTKLEAGSLRLEEIGFCYTNVVEEVLEMVETEAQKKKIRLSFEPNEASETMVKGDPVRVKQVLLNLVSNAVKFTQNGVVSIHVNKKTNRKNICIQCHVRDSGKGIAKEKLVDIFNKFEQADNSITRHHGGTGLGLSISKKLIEIQHGRIWVESELDVGSTFSFEIPYKAAEQNEYKSGIPVNEYNPNALAGKKILVIDDDTLIPEILQPLFSQENILPVFIQDPEYALELIKKQAFDAVFVDLHMPKLTGMDVIKEIKNHPESKNKDAKLVLCTANVIQNFENVSPQNIPDCVLHKPYKQKNILLTLYTLFSVKIRNTEDENQIIKPMSQEYTLKNFKEFAGNDIQLLDNFISLFISESESELLKLEQYLKEKNYKQIGETAHMFKNTYGQLEAKQELLIINKLEGLVKENNNSDEELYHLISSLQEKSKKLFHELQLEMESLKKGSL